MKKGRRGREQKEVGIRRREYRKKKNTATCSESRGELFWRPERGLGGSGQVVKDVMRPRNTKLRQEKQIRN